MESPKSQRVGQQRAFVEAYVRVIQKDYRLHRLRNVIIFVVRPFLCLVMFFCGSSLKNCLNSGIKFEDLENRMKSTYWLDDT